MMHMFVRLQKEMEESQVLNSVWLVFGCWMWTIARACEALWYHSEYKYNSLFVLYYLLCIHECQVNVPV